MLYVIYGASGTGKTTFLNCVINQYGKHAVHLKGTTRAKRQYDDFEIESFPDGLPQNRFGDQNGYEYSSYGYMYGIEKAQIDNALKQDIPHFVICNDIETIKKIRQDYRDKVRVIYFQFDAPKETIAAIQKSRNITDDEIELRISKIDFLEEQFYKNSQLFDTSILNRYGDNPEITLQNDMKSLIDRYENIHQRVVPDKEIIFATIDYLVQLTKEIEQKKSAISDVHVDKGYIFIIMPMVENDESEADANWNTYSTIQTTATRCGFRAAKVDDVSNKNRTIDDKIYENIEKAEIIIADLSYERPNCYYELGYARALGKDVIIISKSGTHIHFDVEHYDRIEYNAGRDLSKKLEIELTQRKNKNN